MKRTLRGFTLVEVLIVMVVIGIMLGATIFVGIAYLQSVKVKSDKQSFSSAYDTITANARTSNYFDDERYDAIDIQITATGISGNARLESGGSSEIASYLVDHGLSFTGSDSAGTIDVEILPYEIGCNLLGMTQGSYTSYNSVDLQLVSSINDDVYCFRIEKNTCKMKERVCD